MRSRAGRWEYPSPGSTSGRTGTVPRRERRDRLKAEIARLFAAREGKDGSPRITAALHEAGWTVSENTVAALMREMGLAARRKKGRKATTRPGKGRWRAPDLVRRSFAAAVVNLKWYGDGTEIPTGEGKLHLASVLDMGSRRILGFALASTRTRSWPTRAGDGGGGARRAGARRDHAHRPGQ